MAKKKKNKSKKSNFSTYILILIILVGLVIMLYPTVADWWNVKHMSQAIDSYVETVASIDSDEKAEMIAKARAYNATLNTGVGFISEETNPEAYEEYLSVLDITGTGIMGYIQIPTIGVNLPIYHGTSDSVLQVATGHIAGSSLPVGGDTTHAVISGHRGLPSAKLFTDLDQLTEGDIFIINVLDESYTYQIDQIHTVLPDEVSDMAITSGKDYVTLVTCTPYGVNTHRMLVRGHRIDNLSEEVKEVLVTSDATKISSVIVALCIAAILIVITLIFSSATTYIRINTKSREVILAELKSDAAKKRNSKNED